MLRKQHKKHSDERTWLLARKDDNKDQFSVLIKENDGKWKYLMPHRNDELLFALLSEKVNLRQLRMKMKKAATSVAKSGNINRTHRKSLGCKYNKIATDRKHCFAYHFGCLFIFEGERNRRLRCSDSYTVWKSYAT